MFFSSNNLPEGAVILHDETWDGDSLTFANSRTPKRWSALRRGRWKSELRLQMDWNPLTLRR